MEERKTQLKTRREAAEFLRLPYNTLQFWAWKKPTPIPFYRVGRHALYRQSDLEAFLEKQRVGEEVSCAAVL